MGQLAEHEKRVAELAGRIEDVLGSDIGVLRDIADDALADAYGSGELDERKAAIRYLRSIGQPAAGMALDAGRHRPPDPEHLAKIQSLTRKAEK